MEATKLTKEQKKARFIERRKALIALSKQVKELVEVGVYEGVNEGIKAIYADEGHTELNTYKGWKANGYQVAKGSEALLIWGSPRKTEQGEEDEDPATKFWPVCYLFSNLQVSEV
ncbi:MAG: hypothetical protein RIC03_12595 [Cyclobacteriaceae bacterium]